MPDVPVAMGAKKPLIVPIWELGSGVHGADGQGNTNLPPPGLEPVKQSAAELLVQLAHEHPGELTLVPSAPLKMSRRRSHLSRRSPNSTRRWF